MAVFRVLILLMLVAGIGCFVAYALSGEARWRAYGIRLVAVTVGLGLAFFAVMIAMRLTEFG